MKSSKRIPPGAFAAAKFKQMTICIGRNADGGRIVMARSRNGNHPVRFLEMYRAAGRRGPTLSPGELGLDGETNCRIRIGWLEPKTEATGAPVMVMIDSRDHGGRRCQVELDGEPVAVKIVDTARAGSTVWGEIAPPGTFAGVIEKAERGLARSKGRSLRMDAAKNKILEAA